MRPDPQPHGPVRALGAQTFVIREAGRFVVYLDVAQPDPSGETPFSVLRRRISDHATVADAEVAARWIARAANRERSAPRFGE